MDIEEIIRQLDDVLDNGEVDEIGITLDPSLPTILHMEGKLGIAKDCLKPLFKHSISKLYELKFQRSASPSPQIVRMVLSISRVVLLIKGDFPVAFETRKNLIEMQLYDANKEIPFTALVFSRHPKCPSGWQHRRWCLQHRRQGQEVTVQQQQHLSCSQIETERQLCRQMAEKHPKNYYAWVHRLWLLPFLNKFQLEDELAFTKSWLYSHVSDHSAVNHRIQVIVRILTCPEALQYIVSDAPPTSGEEISATGADETFRLSVGLIGTMLDECEELLKSRPGHESLWSLRRALCEMLLTHTVRYLCAEAKAAFRNLGGQQIVPTDIANEMSCALPVLKVICVHLAHTIIAHNAAVQGREESADDREGARLSWCLRRFVEYELRLVAVCRDEGSAAWDGAMQSLLAARYAAFLLSRVRHHTCGGEGGGAEQGAQEASTFGSWVLRALKEAQGKLSTQSSTPFQRT